MDHLKDNNLKPVPDEADIYDKMPDTILVVDEIGRISKVVGQFASMFGYERAELVGNSFDLLMPERFRASHEGYVRNFQTAPHIRSMGSMSKFDLFAQRKDGTEFPVDIMLSPVTTETGTLIVAVIRDITASYKVREKLKNLAYCDQLTGLPNWVYLFEDLENYLVSSKDGSPKTISIATLEIDDLKDVNSTYGHSTGDRLVKEIALRMSKVTASKARLYRSGGGEFTIMMQKIGDPVVIAGVVDKLLKQIAIPFDIDTNRIHIAAHAGLAIAPAHGVNVEDLIANARLALNAAKKDSQHGYALYNPALRVRVEARQTLESELRAAFVNEEFEIFFQPQVSLLDGAVLGAEALLRWRHPERGIIGPNAFIESLASSPIAHDVGNWILKTACENAAHWKSCGLPLLRISINLFPAQFNGGTLVSDIENTLDKTGLPAHTLELEITENTAISCEDSIVKPLQILRDRGISIAFDDFGTGYASLRYLTKYPLSRIKIDRSFVRGIPENAEKTAIVRALIAMAHSLDLAIVAEGVETPDQREFLIARGCEEAQGFLYAKPLPNQEFIEFVRAAESRRLSNAGESVERSGKDAGLSA